MSGITGRTYLDPGDRHCGYYDPPRECIVLTQWSQVGGPRNVTVRYADDSTVAVVPFSRRLRRPDDQQAVAAARDARARKVARLWASGLSMREVARRVGIHHQTALDDLARLDRPSWGDYRRRLERRRTPARDKRMTEAVRLRAQGLSLRQIAAELAVSYQTVSNDLARWDAQKPKTPANVIPLRQKVAGESDPAGGKKSRQKLTAGPA